MRSVSARLRESVGVLRSLCEAEETPLHYHAPSKSQIALPADLHALHTKANDATAFVDSAARDWPEKQKRSLHHRATDEHLHAADLAHKHGFEALAGQHLESAHFHAAHAVQHAISPTVLTLHPAINGGAKAGHRLPKDLPPKGTWNSEYGDYVQVPVEAEELATYAAAQTRKAHDLHYRVRAKAPDKEIAHRKAVRAHVKAAELLHQHGFHKQGGEHDRAAQAHLLAIRAIR